jgi:hypothetical protein
VSCEVLGVVPVLYPSRWSWSFHLFLGLPMLLFPFDLYISACLGILSVFIIRYGSVCVWASLYEDKWSGGITPPALNIHINRGERSTSRPNLLTPSGGDSDGPRIIRWVFHSVGLRQRELKYQAPYGIEPRLFEHITLRLVTMLSYIDW